MLEYLGFQYYEVHEDVADGRHGILGVHHLKLGII
jgi:hypothetical protein